MGTMVQVLLHFQTNKDWVQVLRDYLPARFLHPSELERRKTPYPKLSKRNRKAKSKSTALRETSAQEKSTSVSSFDVSKSSLNLDSSKASNLSDPLKAKSKDALNASPSHTAKTNKEDFYINP